MIEILSQVSVSPHTPPTWENLVPWIIGFCFTMVAAVVYVVLKDVRADIKALILEIKALSNYLGERHDGSDSKQEKLGNAIVLLHRERLMQWAADMNSHPMMQKQAQRMLDELEREQAGVISAAER
jgi:hypothetical protein